MMTFGAHCSATRARSDCRIRHIRVIALFAVSGKIETLYAYYICEAVVKVPLSKLNFLAIFPFCSLSVFII